MSLPFVFPGLPAGLPSDGAAEERPERPERELPVSGGVRLRAPQSSRR